ncbi:putative protein isoform X2 [Capsicum galapagoense]
MMLNDKRAPEYSSSTDSPSSSPLFIIKILISKFIYPDDYHQLQLRHQIYRLLTSATPSESLASNDYPEANPNCYHQLRFLMIFDPLLRGDWMDYGSSYGFELPNV